MKKYAVAALLLLSREGNGRLRLAGTGRKREADARGEA